MRNYAKRRVIYRTTQKRRKKDDDKKTINTVAVLVLALSHTAAST